MSKVKKKFTKQQLRAIHAKLDNPTFIPAEHETKEQQKTRKLMNEVYKLKIIKGVELKPETFLHATNSDKNWIPFDGINTVNRLKNRMIKGKEIDKPLLVYDSKENSIEDHEGRHRMYTARKLGIDEVPTDIYCVKHGIFGCKKCCQNINARTIAHAKSQLPSDKTIQKNRKETLQRWTKEDKEINQTRQKLEQVFSDIT